MPVYILNLPKSCPVFINWMWIICPGPNTLYIYCLTERLASILKLVLVNRNTKLLNSRCSTYRVKWKDFEVKTGSKDLWPLLIDFVITKIIMKILSKALSISLINLRNLYINMDWSVQFSKSQVTMQLLYLHIW